MKTYHDFLSGLNLRHISPQEVIRYADRERGGVKNSLPSRELWGNIVPTLWVVDHLRAHFGKPVTLSSIYRSPDYNKAVGGAPRSQHKLNGACDIQVKGVSPKRVFNKLLEWRNAGMFKGGLGLYKTFVHIDTRGRNATW